MIKQVFIAILLYALCYPAVSYADLDDLSGLYKKRIEIIKKYETEVGNDYIKYKEKADTYMEQLKEIDSKYRSIIYSLFYELERGETSIFSNYCPSKEDSYLIFICKFIDYARKKQPKEFLRNLPINKSSIKRLFEIDSIIIGPFGYPKPHPKFFNQTSFVNGFIDTIYQLVTEGHVKAIDMLFVMEMFSDGEFAEYIDNKILDLFENHRNVVIKNWKTIKKYISTIQFDATDYHEKAESIIQNYQTHCRKYTTKSLACKEIIDFLKLKAQI